MNKYKLAIVGCGNIAGGYDTSTDEQILTHAHAINVHDRTSLTGAFDIDSGRAEKFAKKWNTKAFDSMEDMFSVANPDVIVIAVPDEFHLPLLQECLKFKPRAVICEKPVGLNVSETRVVLDEYQSQNIPIAVNYIRRYDYMMQTLRRDILEKKYGDFITASAIYTKGIFHNGSHLINLLLFLFGEVEKVKILDFNVDYLESDPTVDTFLKFKNGYKCYLLAANENKYSVLEVDLFFNEKRITLYQFGFKMRIQSVRTDPLFPNYRDLNEGRRIDTGLNKCLLSLIDNLIDHLEKGEKLLCSGRDALQTEIVCHSILKDLGNSGQV